MEIHARDMDNKNLMYNISACNNSVACVPEDDTVLLKCLVFIYCDCR